MNHLKIYESIIQNAKSENRKKLKSLTDEHKRKISESNKGKHKKKHYTVYDGDEPINLNEKEFNELIQENMQIEYYNDNYDSEGNQIEPTNKWKPAAIDISKIQTKKFSDIKELTFGNVDGIIEAQNGHEGYLCAYAELNFFQYRYRIINGFHPYIYRFEQFEANTFVSNLFKHYDIPSTAYVKNTYQGDDEPILSSIMIAFADDLYLYIDGENKGAIYYNPKDDKDENSYFYTILGLLKGVKTPKVSKNKIYIVYRNQYGFEKMGFDVKKVKIDLKDNYNDGFEEIANNIVAGLNDKNKTNLVILSGEPGTGKCVTGNTKITVRNKKTGKIEEINIADLM